MGKASTEETRQRGTRSDNLPPGPKSAFGSIYQGVLKKTLDLQDDAAGVLQTKKKKAGDRGGESVLAKGGKPGRKKGEILSGDPATPVIPAMHAPTLPTGTSVSGTKNLPSSRGPVLWGPIHPGGNQTLSDVSPATEIPQGIPEQPYEGTALIANRSASLNPTPPSSPGLSTIASGNGPSAGPVSPILGTVGSDRSGSGTGEEGGKKDGEGRTPGGEAAILPKITASERGKTEIPSSVSLGKREVPPPDLARVLEGQIDGPSTSLPGVLSGTPLSPDQIAASGASLAPAAAVTGDPGTPVLPAGLAVRICDMAKSGGGQVSLEVKPPHLGPVGVRVRIDPHSRLVSVELSSHDSRVRHLLSEKEGLIKESLSQSGFVLDRFQVASANPPGGPSGPDAGAMNLSGMGSDLRQDTGDQGSSGGADSGTFQAGLSGQEPGSYGRQGAAQLTGDGGSGSSPQRERTDRAGENGGNDQGSGVSVSGMTGAGQESGFHRIV
jgi:hypothetical protein